MRSKEVHAFSMTRLKAAFEQLEIAEGEFQRAKEAYDRARATCDEIVQWETQFSLDVPDREEFLEYLLARHKQDRKE